VRAELVHDDREHEQHGDCEQDAERGLGDPFQSVTIPYAYIVESRWLVPDCGNEMSGALQLQRM
jgi:hypothetical protein